MNNLQKIGAWLLGGVGVIALLGKQKINFGLKAVQLAGMITNQIIPIKLVTWIANDTIVSVLVRSLSGVLVCNGKTVASISQQVNKRIAANSYVEQAIYVDLHNQETLSALFENINSGDINNLAFELIGEVVVGEQFPVGVKFNRVFTWADIKSAL